MDMVIVPELHTASWNACIVGYSGEANYAGALSMFENSKLEGIIPDEITFTSVLSACTHTGHVTEGILYFESMSRNNGINPDMYILISNIHVNSEMCDPEIQLIVPIFTPTHK